LILLTLHIEAETFQELHAKAIEALYHAIPLPPQVWAQPAPLAEVPVPTPAPTPRAKRAPKAEAQPANDLQARFEALVARDYDSALSILDALNVANFKEAITQGMGDQLSLAMEAFPA
jgi:hypothetical protein